MRAKVTDRVCYAFKNMVGRITRPGFRHVLDTFSPQFLESQHPLVVIKRSNNIERPILDIQ